MKFNKARLEELGSMSDQALWETIKGIAVAYGIRLSDRAPTHDELERVRSMCRGDTKLSMMEALRLMNDYKRGDGK